MSLVKLQAACAFASLSADSALSFTRDIWHAEPGRQVSEGLPLCVAVARVAVDASVRIGAHPIEDGKDAMRPSREPALIR